jgi:hypothetical protein
MDRSSTRAGLFGRSGVVAVYGVRCLLACAIIAPGARASRRRRQGRYGGNQRKGAPMTAPEIQQEIERTRERLGETVDELAAKADVKARARAKAAEVSGRVKDRTADVSGRVKRSQAVRRRWPLAVAAGVLVVGSAVLWRRRKR